MSETKGAMITGSTLGNYQIGLNAFLAGTDKKYIDDQLKKDTGIDETDGAHNLTGTGSGHWIPKDGHQYYWPKANNLDFWAWAPYDPIKQAIENKSTANMPSITFAADVQSFVTSGDGPIKFTYNLGVGTDAVNMPDLMFANADNQAQTKTGCVSLPFMHALAAIKFNITAEAGEKITTISLVDVADKGTCKYSGSSFTWDRNQKDNENTCGTYSHTFNAARQNDGTYDLYTGDNSTAVFMMIPQELAKGQMISIGMTVDGTSPTYRGVIPQGTGENKNWEAGKTYIYNIHIDNASKITITVSVQEWNSITGGRVVFNG